MCKGAVGVLCSSAEACGIYATRRRHLTAPHSRLYLSSWRLIALLTLTAGSTGITSITGIALITLSPIFHSSLAARHLTPDCVSPARHQLREEGVAASNPVQKDHNEEAVHDCRLLRGRGSLNVASSKSL